MQAAYIFQSSNSLAQSLDRVHQKDLFSRAFRSSLCGFGRCLRPPNLPKRNSETSERNQKTKNACHIDEPVACDET
jgi:hypothetical protein